MVAISQNGNIQSHSPTAVVGSNYITIYKYGKVVLFSGYFYVGSTQASGTTLMTISDTSFFPKTNSFIVCSNTSSGTTRLMVVKTTGNIGTGDYSFGSGTWLVSGGYIV